MRTLTRREGAIRERNEGQLLVERGREEIFESLKKRREEKERKMAGGRLSSEIKISD